MQNYQCSINPHSPLQSATGLVDAKTCKTEPLEAPFNTNQLKTDC